MTVYFQKVGWGSDGIEIKVYVKPHKDGSGGAYNYKGELERFYWVNTDDALSIDHKQIPQEHWFAFKYGESEWTLDEGYDFNIKNILTYAKHKERTEEAVQAELMLSTLALTTERDIIDILPIMEKCQYIPKNIADDILKIAHIERGPINNGELGITNLCDLVNICSYLSYLRTKIK